MDSGRREIEIGAEAHGQRLDRVLAGALDGFSRTQVQALIEAGLVREAGDEDPLMKPSLKVRAGDVLIVDVPPPAAAEPAPEAIPLTIVHEDRDVIVIDKPAGLVVHPAPGNWTGTLVNALLHHCAADLSGIGGVRRPGIVHRLDKDTSGLMVVAKTDAAHQDLSEQFADHGRTGPLERSYRAFAWGAPQRAQLTIEAPIGRDPRNRLRMAVTPAGKPALTHVAREAVFGPAEAPLACLLRCDLETGRTHQIRVHCAHAGLPLLGDQVYGAGFKSKAGKLAAAAADALGALDRQALHAAVLGFRHPRTGSFLRFVSELPPELARLHGALASM